MTRSKLGNRSIRDEVKIYEQSPESIVDMVRLMHKAVSGKEELQKEVKRQKEEIDKLKTEKQKEDEQKANSKSHQQRIEILERLGYGAKNEVEKSETREEKFKVPSLRFAEISKMPYESIKEEVDNLATDIRHEYGITVKLVEDIDIKNNPKEKFFISLEDHNGNRCNIDLLKYQENIYNYEIDEEEIIKNEVVKLKGAFSNETVEAAKKIARYISLALGYKETFYYKYKMIGWDKVDDEIIFKYDTIYSNSKIKREGFCGEEWAENIELNLNTEGLEIFNRFFAHTFNSSVKASIILCAGVSGIVRQLVDTYKETNINMNIMGKPGCGKSTIQHLVLGFFGDPTNLEGSFIDTDNANELLRVERVIIPYMLDDRLLKDEVKNDKQKAMSIFISIFREYEGRIKQRLGKQYSDNSLRTYGAIISSSVESILDKLSVVYRDRDLGQYRRFIELKVKKEDLFLNTDHAEAADRLAVNHYGYGVRQVVDYMLLMMRFEKFYRLLMENKVSIEKIFFTVDYLMRIHQEDSDDKIVFNGLKSTLSNELLASFNDLGEEASDDFAEFLNNVKKIRETQENNKEEFVKNINEIVGDNNLAEAVYDLYISNNFVSSGDARKLINSLFEYTVDEVQSVIKSMYTDKNIIEHINPSRQRFALLVLTGYIINFSLSYTKINYIEYDEEIGDYKVVSDNVDMHMDMDKMLRELIGNLYNKLDGSNVINKKNYDKSDVIKLYDWLTKPEHQKYFNVCANNKFLLMKEMNGNTLTIKLQASTSENNRKTSIYTLFANVDCSVEDFLNYEYHDGLLPNKDITQENLEELLKTKLFYIDTSSARPTISQLKNRKAVVYCFDINEIEKARKELQSQEETADETN